VKRTLRWTSAQRHTVAVATAILLLGPGLIGTVGTANGALPPGPSVSGKAGLPAGSVTLITGDRVDLRGDGSAPLITRGPGRTGIPFRIGRSKGHVTVVPGDAASLVAAGRLDARLFDVTALLADGYGDARRPDLSLIVQYVSGADSSKVAIAGKIGRRLASVNGAAVTVAKTGASQWWGAATRSDHGGRSLASPYSKIWLNGKRRVTLDRSAAQIGAPTAWRAGLTGSQVRVAVIDSGIDTSHPDLAGKVDAAANFVSGEPPGDLYGHGTHVASIIAGSAAASDGKYRGIAPDARLLDAKVCGEDGSCADDAILAGMEWAAVTQHAAVVNMSLAGPDTPGLDPLEQAVNTLSAQTGTLFVIAAGNSGPGPGTLESPGTADEALTVGAVDRQDAVADFSSRGPRMDDSGLKPDLTGPGLDIVAARAAGTELGEVVDDRYVALSGTSMATPHVAGAAAILLQLHPDWTNEQVKATLIGSVKAVDASVFDQGAGRVDVAKAISQTVAAAPASLNFGLASWPDDDDALLTKTVTYHNTGSAQVALDLALNVTGPAGSPVPAALFSMSATHVVLPAGGTAQVTLTADTRSAQVPVGRYAGRLVATAAGVTVITPIGVEKESEHYTVTINHVGRDGNTSGSFTTFLDLVGACAPESSQNACGGVVFGSDATTTLRLPPGQYVLADFSSSVAGNDETMMMLPAFELTKDTMVTLDARRAKPVELTAPRTSAKVMNWTLNVNRDMHRDGLIFGYFASGDGTEPLYTADLGAAPIGKDDLVSFIQGRLAEPGPVGDFANSPYEFQEAQSAFGRFFTGVRLRPTQADFATVQARYAAVTDQPRDVKTMPAGKPSTGRPDMLTFGSDFGAPTLLATAPFQRQEFYLAKGLTWNNSVTQGSRQTGQLDFFLGETEWHAYEPGRTYQPPRWSQGVFGPHFSDRPFQGDQLANGLARRGDQLLGGIPTFVDSGAKHVGVAKANTGSGRLFGDGKLRQEWPRFNIISADLPAQEATYWLEANETASVSQISTKVTAAWTFRSGHVEGTGYSLLPLLGVRYDPMLDEHNHARAGAGFPLPIHLNRQPGAGTATVTEVVLETSSDDGASWQYVPVVRAGAMWRATVNNPARGAVSLRVHAKDSDGNALEQTTIRAYLVNP